MRIEDSIRPLRVATLAVTLVVGGARSASGQGRAGGEPVPTTAPPVASSALSMREEDVFDRWLRNSPEVASWRTQVGGARFDVITAKLWPNPELQLLGSFLIDGTATSGVTNYTAQVTVPMPIFGQISARREAADRLVSVAEMNVLSVMLDRAADIQQAMVERAFADARVTMLERNVSELERIRKIVGLRAAAGANSSYDVFRVDTSAGTIGAALTKAKIDLERAELLLLGLVADPTLTAAVVGRDGLASFHGPENEAVLLELALQRRPDLNLAKRGALAFEASARRYRRDAVPTPSLIAAGILTKQPYSVMVTAGVSIPLPISDRNQGQVGHALFDAQGQQFLARALETRIRAEVRSSWRARQEARVALDQFRAQTIAAATELLNRAEVTYEAGKFSITELFDAYQTMWDARQQELELERQSADAEADLEKAAVLLPLGINQDGKR
jgi:cobalt-zinc-cadmium efflux system outer membrane protein